MATQPLLIGFGKASLWGTWQTDNTLADEIDVRVIIARQGDKAAAIAVADFGAFWPRNCMLLRDQLMTKTKIPTDCIGIFTTQNHGTPTGNDPFDLNKIILAFNTAAGQANANLQPAQVAHIAVSPEKPLTFHRRVTLDDIGTFTFWFGFDLDEAGYPHCNTNINSALAMLADGQPYQFRCPFSPGSGTDVYTTNKPHFKVESPLPLGPADDDLVQGLFFRTPDGEPIGSILRMATHPAAANVRGANFCSGDYPVYVRKRVEEAFDGTSLYLNGPCGDQASAVNEKSVDMAKELGTQIAEVALGELGDAKWQEDVELDACSLLAGLTIREDYPVSVEQAKAKAAELEAEIKTAAAEGRPLGEIKKLSDRWEKQLYLTAGLHKNWTGLDLAGCAGQRIIHPIFAMRIGESVIAGLPGEPFGGYSARIREENPGVNVIVAEQGNGYLGYLPTKAEYETGGYGPNAMMFDDKTEEVLTSTVRQAIEQITT